MTIKKMLVITIVVPFGNAQTFLKTETKITTNMKFRNNRRKVFDKPRLIPLLL